MKQHTLHIFLLLFFCLMFSTGVLATHNRAGEITYRQLSENTYEITLITYTYTPSAANETRDSLRVHWGDNTSSNLPRLEEYFMPGNITRNTYKGTHTYPGTGVYEIMMQDPNRNAGVLNIPESVHVVFSIKTTLKIDANIGHNNTPILLNPPVDKAAYGVKFVHNAAAYDPDGDSLSYKLTTCLGFEGVPISNYTLPPASDTLYVDPITGDFVWDTPNSVGIFNVAILIEEWRNGVKIGTIVRDMQIEVCETSNKAPEISGTRNLCVTAGRLIEFKVTATDTINENIKLTATGGPLVLPVNPAQFDSATGLGSTESVFRWKTDCNHIRKQPYKIVFKAEDDNFTSETPYCTGFNMITLENANIKVVGPAPQNVTLDPRSSDITVNWEPPESCSNILGYKIYRKEFPSGFVHDSCQTGVPPETQYREIADIEGIDNTTYFDNNNGKGLYHGIQYCYLVTAYYTSGKVEGYASEEICTDLVRGIPLMTHVSVEKTHKTNGEIFVSWSKPTEFDTIAASGPYKYILFRSVGQAGKDPREIVELNSINDTTYYDTKLNTLDTSYTYQVAFFNNNPPDKYFEIGTPHLASSIFAQIVASGQKIELIFENNVPWQNTQYVIYRKNDQTAEFDSIGVSNSTAYSDIHLINGREYCYRIKSTGDYNLDGITSPLINYSQIVCGVPIDTIPPCNPDLSVRSNCNAQRNELQWTNPNETCTFDTQKYKIYYSATLKGDLQEINTIPKADSLKFYHEMPENTSLAGCYAITAIDSTGNESVIKTRICVDECINYELPNVFTPDGDGFNDYYHPLPYQFVEKVDMRIFNRWGQLVFETNDPDINWNGKHKDTGKLVTEGVYYYICDVYEKRLTGLEPRNIAGFIHVYSKESVKKP